MKSLLSDLQSVPEICFNQSLIYRVPHKICSSVALSRHTGCLIVDIRNRYQCQKFRCLVGSNSDCEAMTWAQLQECLLCPYEMAGFNWPGLAVPTFQVRARASHGFFGISLAVIPHQVWNHTTNQNRTYTSLLDCHRFYAWSLNST